ncbi:Hypothetical protein LUCI_1200 [Lucifera butyrica]|uniref:Uncharacterized protein n=1 Tax=Lucifera butyrica TaxID=1351585 RepID=A0A498R4A9_9FIRM|nr:hypothetical protein [Lucifera butyrica]VBB05989.1 Hypothetical protein LUCI_1200 [Lucifera butyrica]
MWPEIYNFLLNVSAVILCCIAVKLTDDFLDQEFDIHSGINWAQRYGAGTMVYAMLILALAAAMNPPLTLSLFLGSYIVGMFNQFTRLFPSHLTGWQESLLVFFIGAILFGWNLMLFAVLFVLSVQLLDDCLDRHLDSMCGMRNLAQKYGLTECALLALFCLMVAWLVNEQIFSAVFSGFVIFYLTMLHFQRRASQ